MIPISYCNGFLDGGKYCPLAEICYRCCDCHKERQMRRYGKLNGSFAQYDAQTHQCPHYMNQAQWGAIRLLQGKTND